MIKNVRLCIYDEYTNSNITIKEAPQPEIDRITTKFEDKKELIDYLSNKQKIISDIKILNIVNKEKRILFKWHLEQIEELSENEKFFSFLEKNYEGYAETLDKLSEPINQTLEEYYSSIREIYDIYEKNYRKLGQPSLDKIYTKYKQQKNSPPNEYIETLFEEENYQYKKSRGEKKNDRKNNM